MGQSDLEQLNSTASADSGLENRVVWTVVGLGLGGPRQDKKEGPSDDIIILSQP